MKFYIGSGLKNFNKVNELSKKLIDIGWEHTFNWAAHGSVENETVDDLANISVIEQNAIVDSDVVIILLPAGRGTHVELGMSIVLEKNVFLLSADGKDFEIENTAGFYWHPNVIRIIGDIDVLVNQIQETNINKSM